METVNNTILIIEDDLGLNELISEKIKELGFQTYSVFSVDEAINWLSQFVPHLMVVDYSLSGSTAKDFINFTKSKGLTLPPFVVTTGQGDERIAVEMMKLGARDYIIKDTNLLELLPRIISRVAKEIDNENKLKLAEIELKESEEKYRILLENSGIGIGVYDLDGKVLMFNQKALQNLGGKKEDYIGKTLIEIFGEEIGNVYLKRIQDTAQSDISLEFEDNFLSETGDYWFISNHTKIKNNDGKIIGIQILSHDITERKIAQEKIAESEIRFRKLLQDIQTVSVQGYAPDGTTQYWNKASERLYGYSAEEAIGKNLIDLIIPTEMRTGVKHAMEQMAKSGQAITASELTLKRKDGSQVTVFSNHAIVQVSGQPQELFCIDIDLTEIKQAQEALRESEEKYRLLIENSGVGVGVFNLDGKVLLFNQKAIQNLGGKKEDYFGKTLNQIFGDDMAAEYHKRIADTVKSEKSIDFEDYVETKSGNYWFISNFSRIINASGEIDGVQILSHDITERKLMENVNNFLITCGLGASEENFFESLAKYLSEILEMEYVCIDTLDGDGLTAHTLAIYNDGVYDTNVSYTLKQTPCGEVIGKNICCFPENVINLFPNDAALRDLNAESYVGTTLWSFDNKPIGLIAIIGRKPLKNPIMANNILRLVSVRAAGELERKKGEEALIKKNADLDYMNKFMVNREVRMADMKKEVNELLERLGEEKRYL